MCETYLYLNSINLISYFSMKNTEQFLKIDEHFPFGPSLLVCQSIDISNQMVLTCKVSNFEQKKTYIWNQKSPNIIIELHLMYSWGIKGFNKPLFYLVKLP